MINILDQISSVNRKEAIIDHLFEFFTPNRLNILSPIDHIFWIPLFLRVTLSSSWLILSREKTTRLMAHPRSLKLNARAHGPDEPGDHQQLK